MLLIAEAVVSLTGGWPILGGIYRVVVAIRVAQGDRGRMDDRTERPAGGAGRDVHDQPAGEALVLHSVLLP